MKLNVNGRLEEVSMFYVLDENGEPKEADDLETWALWWSDIDNRRIARDELVATYPPDREGEDITVSTVFMGIDHNFHDFGEPVLFETLVFGGLMDEEMWRYTTREEAVKGHAEMLLRVKAIGAEEYEAWLDRMDSEEDTAE